MGSFMLVWYVCVCGTIQYGTVQYPSPVNERATHGCRRSFNQCAFSVLLRANWHELISYEKLTFMNKTLFEASRWIELVNERRIPASGTWSIAKHVEDPD